jgi:hypothetical protein
MNFTALYNRGDQKPQINGAIMKSQMSNKIKNPTK